MTMLSWHVAGQKVVCVDDCPHLAGDDIAARLEVDRIYTIREVTLDDLNTRVGFLLVEVVNPPSDLLTRSSVEGIEPSYAATRFRPVRPTSIEALRFLLSPTPERVDVLEDA